jgi:hypothetical protein
LGGTNEFENVTYRRKSTVINPTTAFDLAEEWDAYDTNDVTDLGSHSTTLGMDNFEELEFSFSPNPVHSNQVFFNATSALKVEIYSLTGELVINASLNHNTKALDISALNSGLYIVKMSTSTGVNVRKLIRQ